MNEREFNEWAAGGGLVQDEYTNLPNDDAPLAQMVVGVDTTPARPETVVGKLHAAMAAVNAKSIWLPNVKVTTAKANSTNPGALYLKDNDGVYVGKVTADGVFKRAWEQNLTNEAKNELRQFVIEGAAYLANVGKETGQCCFCGLELTDPESVQRGYGPVCAKKHGLPHGNRNGF